MSDTTRILMRAALVALLALAGSLGACDCGEPPNDADPIQDSGAARDAALTDHGLRDSGAEDQTQTTDAAAAVDGAADAADVGDAGFVCEFPEIDPIGGGDGGAECPVELADATGVFEGTWLGNIFGDSFLTGPFNMTTSGDLRFEILCLGDKLWVEGEMTGMAQGGFPFWGTLRGEYDVTNQQLVAVVSPGNLCMAAATDAGVADVGEDAGAEDAGFEDASFEDGGIEDGSIEDGPVTEDAAHEDATEDAALEDAQSTLDASQFDSATEDAMSSLDAVAADSGEADAGGFSCAGLVVEFEVALTGVRFQDRFDDGAWCGSSIWPPGANGFGSWTAQRLPDD